MTVELAEFGVIVRTILPGIGATRIFTKIDRGNSIPDARWPAETVARISPFYAAELPYPQAAAATDTASDRPCRSNNVLELTATSPASLLASQTAVRPRRTAIRPFVFRGQ